MKHLIAATLVTALPALAADKIITVTFDSIVNTPNKAGERLDPSLFSFGRKPPERMKPRMLRAARSASPRTRPAGGRCWAAF
jgi:hypothetical protein